MEAIEAPRNDGEPDARYAEAVLARVEDLAVSRQITELKSRLQRLNPVESQDTTGLSATWWRLSSARKRCWTGQPGRSEPWPE